VGKQVGRAAASGARYAVVIGEEERRTGRIRAKDLVRGEETEVAVGELPGLVRQAIDGATERRT
jgi:histidyl-tRNA synthetase